MKLDFDICSGGRYNGKNVIGIRYNGIDIFSLIGYYNAYTVEILPDGNRTVEFTPLYDFDYYKKKEYYDMGDGSIFYEDITDWTYTYKEPGTYLIITSGKIFGSSNLGLNYNVVAINGIRRDIKRLYDFCSYSTLREFKPVNIKTSNISDMSWMFNNCQSLTELDLSNFDTSNVTKMNRMFDSCYSLAKLDISNWDTSKVEDMSNIFNNCQSLTELDVSKFITSNVTTMKNMFGNCESLTELDVSKFDTNGVTDMSGMFGNCESLTSLDLSNWDTSNVTDMKYMFGNCRKLTSLNLSNWDTSNVTNISSMLYFCNRLQILRLDNCNADTINKIINSSNFPVDNNGTIYCRRANAEGLTAPGNWMFSYIDID